jgi:uncharacterized protein YndB with AHSA1/START domain
MTDTLRISFEVACRPDHAFAVWTERIGMWWPPDHTVTGAPTAVVLEGRVGGRIYERTGNGEEHDWGEITTWHPPDLLAYRWHLGVGRESATQVAIRFSPLGESGTRVDVEQSDWEHLGAAAEEIRNRNESGWQSLVPHFRAATERGA